MLGGAVLAAALSATALSAAILVRRLVRRGGLSSSWEVQVLTVALIVAGALMVVVEGLSAFRWVSQTGLILGWIAAAAVLYGFAEKLRKSEPNLQEPASLHLHFRSWLQWSSWTLEEKVLAFITAFAVTCLFFLAVLTAPTSWDSMTYHLPRVLNWIQNGSVAPYVTSDTRQIESGPFAAYAVMQLYFVTGDDRLVSLVQWGAMVLSLVGVSWLTGEVLKRVTGEESSAATRTRTTKVWSALLVVSMPIGIVQAITAQTDYVVAFWFLSALVFGLLLGRSPANLFYAAAFAGSIALGVLTKATMVLISGVCLAVLFLWMIRRSELQSRLKIIGMVAATFLLLLTPQFARNLSMFGSPLGSRYIHELMVNGTQSPQAWWSNTIRNMALHAASGVPVLTTAVNSLLRVGHDLSGLDPNDQRTTLINSPFAFRTSFALSDNSAGNFWHAVIIAVGAGILLMRVPKARTLVGAMLLIAVVSLVAQSAYLRWNEWNARFHFPLFLFLVPLPSIAFASLLPMLGRAVVVLGLSFLTFYSTFYNQSRPVLGGSDFVFREREEQYFLQVPYLYEPALHVVNDIIASGSTHVGIRLYKNFLHFQDEMEYPFWVMLKNRGFAGKIYNLGVTNETARVAPVPPVQVLLSSFRGADSEVTAMLPYKVEYPPLKLFWAEGASRWAQLSQIKDDAAQRPLSAQFELIQFSNSVALLSCRVPRPGILRLQGGLADGKAPLPGPTAVAIESYAGFITTARSASNAHLIEIPLPPGQTAIQLGTPPTQPNLYFALSAWQWFPTEQPLPYAYVTRFYLKAGGRGSTNTMSLPSGQSRTLEFFTGAAGTLDVVFEAAETISATLNITAANLQTNIAFTNGAALVRVPVTRGTNTLEVTSPATNQNPVLEINNVALRFRDFVD